MVKVTVNQADESTAAKLIGAGNRAVDVADAQGRTLTLKKPAPLARLDFAKAAGGGEINQLYLAEVMHLPYVAAIDGVAVASPASEGELRALYARLGDDGNDAAQLGVLEHFMPKPAAEAEAELKNG
ncbi:MAG: hypothetical protein M3N34_00995 [Pseudomonadota bacterium]|nr:hypothetical protein [Pseudomonadota bacterium]